jgi:hypothetical protein
MSLDAVSSEKKPTVITLSEYLAALKSQVSTDSSAQMARGVSQSAEASNEASSKGPEKTEAHLAREQTESEVRSKAILHSAAAALSIAPSSITSVRVSAWGSVYVEGNLKISLKEKLERTLQANAEFMKLSRNVQSVATQDLAADKRAVILNAYA